MPINVRKPRPLRADGATPSSNWNYQRSGRAARLRSCPAVHACSALVLVGIGLHLIITHIHQPAQLITAARQP
jgi:hypothetical protein